MKKKILSFVLAMCMMFPCALLLTACGGGLELGVDYKVDNVEVVWGSEEEKTAILGTKTEEEYLANYKNNTGKIKFNEDGTMISTDPEGEERTYYYTADGDILKIYTDQEKQNEVLELTVEGNKLVQKYTVSDYDTFINVFYKKA